MSPVMDPRYAAKRRESQEKEQQDADRAARMEYIKPAVMFVVGFAVTLGFIIADSTAADDEEPIAVSMAVVYLISFVFSLACGVGGLWLAAKLWLGGVGPLGLSILRLAGIYAVTDLVGVFVQPLLLLGLLIRTVVYVVLLMWLFELEPTESIMLALITWVLKILGTVVIVLALTSA